MTTQRARNDLNGCRVLICEDEAILVMQLRKIVTHAGCQVVGEATSGEDAILLANELEPDLVLMDLTLLGDQNGIAAARSILSRRRVPILMLTGINDPEVIDAAEKAGVAGFFVKPVFASQLIEAIQTVLDRFHTMPDETHTSEA